eukprot:408749_1
MMTVDNVDNGEFDSYNLDTSQFWKNRDESTKTTMDEKLLNIARNGPASEFIAILNQETASISALPSHCTYSIDLDIVDSSGWCPLIHASFNGHTEIVKHILLHQENKYTEEHGDELIHLNDNPDLEEDANDGTSPAIKEIKPELKWKYLFKKFISRKVKWNGSTALHLSCARGHDAIAKLLIHKMVIEYKIPLDFSINSIDFDMATPLHCAVLGKHYEICKLLLTHGGIATKKDIRGKTPLDWAKERNLSEYISLLSDYETKNNKEREAKDDDTAQLVASIWENEERKSMESPMSNQNITSHDIDPLEENYDNNAVPFPSQHMHPTHIPSFHLQPHPQQNVNHPYNAHNRWHKPQQMQQMQPTTRHNNNNNKYHHTHPHPYRVLAPRHQRYMQYNQYALDRNNRNNNDTMNHPNGHEDDNHENRETVSCSPLLSATASLPELQKAKSCPVTPNLQENNATKNDDEEEESTESTTEVAAACAAPIMDDPSFDAMKFQNKYLKARCETLEREQKEIATQYKQQLMRETNQWRVKHEQMVEQLEGKQNQIHELRHTLRRMRRFLDNLPVRMKRNFYGDDGNFSKELYENQQMAMASSTNESKVNKNGWKTVNLNKQEVNSKNSMHPREKSWRVRRKK